MKTNNRASTEMSFFIGTAKRLVVLAVLFHAAAVCAAPTPQVSAVELRRLQLIREPSLVIVDVRPPADFVKGHIQGAVNVIAAAIEGANLPRNGHIIVYCSEPTCPLSARAASTLISDGYQQVALLEGGFDEWVKNGYPVQETTTAQAVNETHPRTTTAEAGPKMDGGALTLDVRPDLEFKAGHIPHARNIPLEQLDQDLVRLPKDRELVVYDRTPARSRQAADKLTAAGFTVSELSGGLAGWTKRGKTLVTKE